MKKYIISTAIVLFAAFSFAQSTDAVFKKIRKEYILHIDGSMEYRYQKELQLNSHYAFNRLFGETFVVYNPDFQYVVVHEAYTIMANGRKVEVPENAFNKVLPRQVSAYPAYNQMIELVITHTALEVGATIFLDYSIMSKPEHIKELMGTEILQERVPVEDYELVLKVPARRALNYSVFNTREKPKENNDNEYRTLEWKFRDVKAQSYEHASPKAYDTAPVIKFSTFSDTKYLFDAFVSQMAFKESSTQGLSEMIAKSQKSTHSELELALEIQKYIVNNISTKHIPLAWHNYQLQTPEQVWKANVGSVEEKVVLLWQATVQAGLNAEVVALYPMSLYDNKQADFENMAAFGVMLSLKDGSKMILSASDNNTKSLELLHPDCVVLSLKNASVVDIESANRANLIHLTSHITIDPENQIYGDLFVLFSGASFNYIALQQDTQKLKRYISHALPYADNEPIKARIVDAYNGQFDLTIKGDASLKKQENYYFWDMPYVNNGIASMHLNVLPVQRDFPMVVTALEETYEYFITLPKSVMWVGNDIHISYKERFAEMTIDIAMKDGKLKVRKHFWIYDDAVDLKQPKTIMPLESKKAPMHQRILSVEEYEVFREMMNDWNAEKVNELVFKR